MHNYLQRKMKAGKKNINTIKPMKNVLTAQKDIQIKTCKQSYKTFVFTILKKYQ